MFQNPIVVQSHVTVPGESLHACCSVAPSEKPQACCWCSSPVPLPSPMACRRQIDSSAVYFPLLSCRCPFGLQNVRSFPTAPVQICQEFKKKKNPRTQDYTCNLQADRAQCLPNGELWTGLCTPTTTSHKAQLCQRSKRNVGLEPSEGAGHSLHW